MSITTTRNWYILTYRCYSPGPTHHPLNLIGVVLNSTSFLLTWSPPPAEHHNGKITEYRVNVTERMTGRTYSFSTVITRLIVTELHPYFLYECVASAVTVAEGPYSAAIVVRTHQAGKLFKLHNNITILACTFQLLQLPHKISQWHLWALLPLF